MNTKTPRHIVLFPDGNRRWAKERGLKTIEGHKAGYQNLLNFCQWCQKRGIQIVTAFGFSTENWKRPAGEVSYLMHLLESALKKHLNDPVYERLGVRMRIIGQKECLPGSLRKIIEQIEEKTKNHNKLFLNLAVSYGGRWDIVQAVQKIVASGFKPEKVTEELIEQYLSLAGLPHPDLVIRAGGEMRLSNFVLWQAAYSELYFSKKYWPDFSEEDLEKALEEYDRRQRRFGR
jgi:undecaprenyl diphosphate synthase